MYNHIRKIPNTVHLSNATGENVCVGFVDSISDYTVQKHRFIVK